MKEQKPVQVALFPLRGSLNGSSDYFLNEPGCCFNCLQSSLGSKEKYAY